MAMTLRPTDGLVSRLLQQQTRSHPVSAQDAPTKGVVADQVNISEQAREHQSQAAFKQQKLESQLLRLYSHHANQNS